MNFLGMVLDVHASPKLKPWQFAMLAVCDMTFLFQDLGSSLVLLI
jgi:hypothetical protein